MGIISETYSKNIEERKKPIVTSFGEIPMRVSGYAELKEWDDSTAKRRQTLIENNMELYAAMVLKQWSLIPGVSESSEEEIVADIRKDFIGDDVSAVVEWWLDISGVLRTINFQKRR